MAIYRSYVIKNIFTNLYWDRTNKQFGSITHATKYSSDVDGGGLMTDLGSLLIEPGYYSIEIVYFN